MLYFKLLLLIPALIFAGGFCGFKNPTLDFALQPVCNSAIFPPLWESAVFHAPINFGCTVANHDAFSIFRFFSVSCRLISSSSSDRVWSCASQLR